MSELRDDHPFNDCSPIVEQRAKQLARNSGHNDVEAIIVCSDGETHGLQVPVWKFYIADAKLAADSEELCADLERVYALPPLPASKEHP